MASHTTTEHYKSEWENTKLFLKKLNAIKRKLRECAGMLFHTKIIHSIYFKPISISSLQIIQNKTSRSNKPKDIDKYVITNSDIYKIHQHFSVTKEIQLKTGSSRKTTSWGLER